MKLLKKIFNFIMPKKCYFCGQITSGEDICQQCMQTLPWREKTGVEIEYADGCYAPLRYEGKAADAIRRFKFNGVQQMDKCLGGLMYDCVCRSCSAELDLVTWVPVNFMRRQKRKYDQAYLLAKQIADMKGMPCKRLLVKRRNISPQYSMNGHAERKANVSGAYCVTHEKELMGKRILLADDIVTSGSTLNECSRLLLTAGAQSVVCVCAAKAGK